MKKILAIALAAIMAVMLSACVKLTDPESAPASSSTAASSENSSAPASTASSAEKTTLTEYAEAMYAAVSETEINSSARVDAIIMQAKDDAALVSSSIVADAATSIINNYPAYYGDDATMELYIYLGALLEYTNVSDDYAKLGQYTTEAIKYVYRGAESQTDEATLNKLAQVKELADKL